MARYTLLNRLPPELYQLLSSYRNCEARSDTYRWLDIVAESILGHVQPLSGATSHSSNGRAMCPLCGDGANSYYEQGFSFPEGLRRHLVGYGNTHQCVFTDTAMKLASNDWKDRFSEEEENKRVEMEEKAQARRKVERMYRIDPLTQPKLADEGMFYGSVARTPQQMESTRNRMASLGLKCVVDGNVEAWVDDRDAWVVYADPRGEGRIDFTVWKKPLPKRTSANNYKYHVASFHILDSWKNELKKKYESRLPAING
ncbi:MAG TPA: hypothetical protein VF471_14145 [Pseudoxanthomonas sp.]